jgi:hypothetical protein
MLVIEFQIDITVLLINNDTDSLYIINDNNIYECITQFIYFIYNKLIFVFVLLALESIFSFSS